MNFHHSFRLSNSEPHPKSYSLFKCPLDRSKKYLLTLAMVDDIIIGSNQSELVFKYQVISETLIIITYFCYNNGSYHYPAAEVMTYEVPDIQ